MDAPTNLANINVKGLVSELKDWWSSKSHPESPAQAAAAICQAYSITRPLTVIRPLRKRPQTRSRRTATAQQTSQQQATQETEPQAPQGTELQAAIQHISQQQVPQETEQAPAVDFLIQ